MAGRKRPPAITKPRKSDGHGRRQGSQQNPEVRQHHLGDDALCSTGPPGRQGAAGALGVRGSGSGLHWGSGCYGMIPGSELNATESKPGPPFRRRGRAVAPAMHAAPLPIHSLGGCQMRTSARLAVVPSTTPVRATTSSESSGMQIAGSRLPAARRVTPIPRAGLHRCGTGRVSGPALPGRHPRGPAFEPHRNKLATAFGTSERHSSTSDGVDSRSAERQAIHAQAAAGGPPGGKDKAVAGPVVMDCSDPRAGLMEIEADGP